MSLNAGKTNYIVIRPKHMRCDLTGHDIFIQNTKLDRIGNDCDEKAVKFLRITLKKILPGNITYLTLTKRFQMLSSPSNK